MKLYISSLSILLMACGSDDLPQVYDLGPLRVLAIKASVSNPLPGEAVSIDPLISFASRVDDVVTHQAVACVDPGVSAGAEAVCDDQSLGYQVLLEPTAVDFTSGPMTGGAGSPLTLSYTIPVTATEGLAFIVIYKLSSGQTVELSYKRMVVRASTSSANQNPTLSSINDSNGPISQIPEEVKVLYLDVSDPESEELTSTWMVSEGTFPSARTVGTANTSYTPPLSVEKSPLVMIVVSRDPSGGLAWLKLLR